MKYTPEPDPVLDQNDFPLTDELSILLQEFRNLRGFTPEKYVKNKTNKILDYMHSYGLKTLVVGVSGGIDSAVVLGLCASVKEKDESINVAPVLIPSLSNDYVTNQEDSVRKGKEVCEHFGLKPIIFNELSSAVELLSNDLSKSTGLPNTPWSLGQLVSYQRTPVLYYVTSLYTAHGKPALLCGTTNYSEGAYIGYVGKASDGMVDIQVISDIYKSEVYAIADYLNIPSSVAEAEPNGDMFDSRTDEQVFGASYDFLELFLEIKHNTEYSQATEVLIKSGILGEETKKQFLGYSDRLEGLHKYNKHKYIGHSPAVHLDVIDNPQIENGWQREKR